MSLMDGGTPTEWEAHRLKIRDSQGSKKIFNYIQSLSKESEFQKDWEDFRVRFGFPKEGFSPEEDHEMFDDVAGDPVRYSKKVARWSKKRWDEYSDLENQLRDKYKIPSGGGIIMAGYIMYNHVGLPFLTGSLCQTTDVEDLIGQHEIGELNLDYPVLIEINPYASLRDIIDYITAVYSNDILPLQEKYADKEVRLGKVRKKNENVQKRNAFIKENKHLPLKEIATLLRENGFGATDEGLISKIRSGKF